MIRPIGLDPQHEGEPDTLVFVPDGALRTIPFAALRDRDTKRFLIEMHPVAMTPSLTLTDPRPVESARIRVLAAGISVYFGWLFWQFETLWIPILAHTLYDFLMLAYLHRVVPAPTER